MCGIAGILYRDPARPVARAVLKGMADAIAHRGPDAEGFLALPGIGLAHRRLSIIDLAGGDQPIGNEDGTVQVVFNGEIYNYRELRRDLEAHGHHFRTHSDTEVLVHLYEEQGAQLVEKLRGMFAFALWDARERRLVLARDRVGIKPLYVYRDGEKLLFGSELKAILAHPGVEREVEPEALEDYLALGVVPGHKAIFRRMEKLPPAHVLVVRADSLHAAPRRYWQLRFEPDEKLSEGEWREAIAAKLAETVRAHLIADVPVGAFLSGGLDSSVVVAEAAAGRRQETGGRRQEAGARVQASGGRKPPVDRPESGVEATAADLSPNAFAPTPSSDVAPTVRDSIAQGAASGVCETNNVSPEGAQPDHADHCKLQIANCKLQIDAGSATLTPIAQRLRPPTSDLLTPDSCLLTPSFATFSMGFAESAFSELPFARQVAERFGTRHVEEFVTPDAAQLVDELAFYYDEPFADSSAVPTYLVAQLARRSVKVVLSGDGGDEAFGGYARYAHDLREAALRDALPGWLRRGALGPLGRAWPKADWLPRALRAKTLFTNLSLEAGGAYANTITLCRSPLRRRLMAADLAATLNGHQPEKIIEEAFREGAFRPGELQIANSAGAQRHPVCYSGAIQNPKSKIQNLDVLAGMLAADTAVLLPDDFLTKVDRASMAHGLEVRPPLVDHELLELMARVPSRLKVRRGETKWILKRTYEDRLPRDAVWRAKHGFEIPVDAWLRGPLREMFEASVLATGARVAEFVNQREVRRLYRMHRAKVGRHGGVLWTMLTLAKWAERWLN